MTLNYLAEIEPSELREDFLDVCALVVSVDEVGVVESFFCVVAYGPLSACLSDVGADDVCHAVVVEFLLLFLAPCLSHFICVLLSFVSGLPFPFVCRSWLVKRSVSVLLIRIASFASICSEFPFSDASVLLL